MQTIKINNKRAKNKQFKYTSYESRMPDIQHEEMLLKTTTLLVSKRLNK